MPMLNPSPKSVSPEKNHFQCVLQWNPHPSITTDWEMLSGTASMGQKLQQWEGRRAVPRASSSFIWCSLSCPWEFFCAVEKPRELEEDRYEKRNLKLCPKEMLKLRWRPYVNNRYAKFQLSPVGPEFSLSVLFTEFLAVPSKDGLVMKFAWK